MRRFAPELRPLDLSRDRGERARLPAALRHREAEGLRAEAAPRRSRDANGFYFFQCLQIVVVIRR